MNKASLLSITMCGTLLIGTGCEKHGSDAVTQVPEPVPNKTQPSSPAAVARHPSRPAPPPPVAPVSNGSVAVVPTQSGLLKDRWKTGPNAQTDLKPNPGYLKTGLNAQTDLRPDSGRLKTGPNAQTDLTLKRSW